MHLSPRHPRTSRALARLQDESGIALVMALGIMLVLAIVFTTTIFFTSASVRHANNSNAGQKAYALAETGVNNAIAQIAPRYPNQTTAGDPSWLVGTMTKPYGANNAAWWGSWSGSTNSGTWTLTGKGTVRNPTGGADITRTVTAKIDVWLVPPPFTKYGLFVNSSVLDTDVSGNNTITVPVYAAGDLSLGGSVKIQEPASSGTTPETTTVSVNVGGTLSGSGHVGTSAKKINWLAAGGGCDGGACPNGAHAHTIGTHVPVALPTINMATQYGKANWSAATCTGSGSNPFDTTAGTGAGVRDNSRGSTNLMGSQPYDCTARDGAGTVVGRLAWNPSTKTLLVDGTVFVDGNLDLSPSDGLQYSGSGWIYVNGTGSIKGTICGPGSSWNGSTCGQTWSPVNGLGAVMIVFGGAANNTTNALTLTSQAVVEAGLWLVRGKVDGNGGPYLGGSLYVDDGFADLKGGGGLQAFINLPAGAPTGGDFVLGTPRDFAGG